MEEQILLRVPPELALRLNRLIEEGKASSSSSSSFASTSSISLTLNPSRRGVLHLDKASHDGTLVDLPCLVETHKTFDNIAYYKAADIAQMLILHPLPTAVAPATTSPAPTAGGLAAPSSEKAKEAGPPPIRYPSGLLPPTRDIRPKRYERDTVIPVSAAARCRRVACATADA